MIGRWSFKVKLNADGSINKYKARLVAQVFTQQRGVEYNKTFTPDAKQSTLQNVLSVAAGEILDAEQVDVDTAFRFTLIEKELYIRQPHGYEGKTHTNKVCRLLKSLQGAKQAARQWNRTLDQFFVAMILCEPMQPVSVYAHQLQLVLRGSC